MQTCSTARQPALMLALVVCAWIGVACVSTHHPRPANIAPPGRLSWDGHLPLVALEAGEAEIVGQPPQPAQGETPRAERLTLDGAMSSAFGPPLASSLFPVWFEWAFRVGVFEGCEAGALLGLFRQGAEARCGVLQERWGHPVSVALGGAVAALPFYERVGPWWRADADISALTGPKMRLMGRLSLTHGPERRVVLETPPKRLWDPTPDPNTSDVSRATLWFEQVETRVSLALGVGVWGARANEDGSKEFVVGVAPYWVVRSASPHASGCVLCSATRMERWNAGFGAVLTVGLAGRPERHHAEPVCEGGL